MSTVDPDFIELVDITLPLPSIWVANEMGDDQLADTEQELIEMLTGKVDDPESTAKQAMADFLDQVGGGRPPLLLASFREVMDDESLLSATLTVTKNELGGSLEPWRQAYADADDIEVMDAPALRTFETTMLNAPELFDEGVHVLTWRYIVPFDERSILMFAFTTPNHELDDIFLEHFDDIMSEVSITHDR